MGNDLGVFEAMENAGKISAEATANSGFKLEKDIDRAIFRAKEKFGTYLANSQSKSEFDERWTEVKAKGLLSVVAEVTTPTPGVLRKVEAALRPSLPQAKASTKRVRPTSSAKTVVPVVEVAPTEDTPLLAVASFNKTAWSFDQGTKLYTSSDPMQKFACPGCNTEQPALGFTKCAGCDRTWNSWPVRQSSSAKTGASTYVIMAREIKMRGDQFKMAAAGNVKVADGPMEPPPGMSQPMGGTMPGDNSAATNSPMPAEQPPTPGGAGPGPEDIAGGVTEDSPIDQIQDALQGAIVALKDVQMLSINPQLSAMASTAKGQKVAVLREKMDHFWALHKQMNYVAGMLAKEANEAILTSDPRITTEAEFVRGFSAAAKNEPLPSVEKTGRAYLEGYVAFHNTGSDYNTGVDSSRTTVPTGDDESVGASNGSSWLDGTGPVETDEERGDSGPFDASQPASQNFARDTDRRNADGERDRGQGQSGSIQPTGSRRSNPKVKS